MPIADDIWIAATLIVVVGVSLCVLLLVELKSREEEKFNNSVATDERIIELFYEVINWVAETETEEIFDSYEKPIRTKQGNWRVDFQKAVDRRLDEMALMGVSSDAVLKYLHSQGENPLNKDVKICIQSAIESIIEENEKNLSKEIVEDGITPSEFFVRKTVVDGDCVGVYVIHNLTKDMYYVGQAKRLYFRVNQHFTGHGNGDVYADYKYGDQFRIKLILLSESGYDDLDKLERDMILKYHAKKDGYNKTYGNR